MAQVIDFKDMPMGVIQLIWSGGTGALDGAARIYASAVPDLVGFDLDGTYVDCSEMTTDKAAGSKIWIRDRLSFRYALVRYTANGMTGGVVDIIALGKKS